MIQLDFAVLARAASAAENLLYIHGGAIRTADVDRLPAGLPLAVAARLTATRDEIGKDHAVGLRTFAPNSEETAFGAASFPLRLVEEDLELDVDPEISVLVAITVGALPVTEAGEYRVELLLDDVPIATLPLRIRLIPEETPAAEPSP